MSERPASARTWMSGDDECPRCGSFLGSGDGHNDGCRYLDVDRLTAAALRLLLSSNAEGVSEEDRMAFFEWHRDEGDPDKTRRAMEILLKHAAKTGE